MSERDTWATAIDAIREALRVAYYEERRTLLVVQDRIKQCEDRNLMEWNEAGEAHQKSIAARVRAEESFRGVLMLRDRIRGTKNGDDNATR